MNFLRTGYRSEGLLDVHFVTDEDIAARRATRRRSGPSPTPHGSSPSAARGAADFGRSAVLRSSARILV